MPGGFVQQAPGLLKIGEKQVQHITQPRRRVAHTVGQVQPALRVLWAADPGRFNFLHCVVVLGVEDHFLLDLGQLHTGSQPQPMPPPAPTEIKPSWGRV